MRYQKEFEEKKKKNVSGEYSKKVIWFKPLTFEGGIIITDTNCEVTIGMAFSRLAINGTTPCLLFRRYQKLKKKKQKKQKQMKNIH